MKKIVFSKGPAPKYNFMYNGDTLEVVKQQFFHVLALLILQSQETSMCGSVKGYVWYNKTNWLFDVYFDLKMDFFD